MNCTQAKKIDIVSFLLKNGIKPVRENNRIALYQSPLRCDMKPSLIVDKNRNLYYDYGTGEGGSIVDLGSKLYQCSISDFLNRLDNKGLRHFSQTKQNERKNIEITSVERIKNIHLLDYAMSRKITPDIIKENCREVSFNVNDKKLYAIGFSNSKGGFELRNEYYKGCASPKSISHIKNGADNCCLFEGFFDYLSFLVLKKESFPKTDFIILNSVALINHIYKLVDFYGRLFFIPG